ncbi:MAG TPA: class I SAM-dependent methyltransferase [Polyangiaceae bacterium]|nr:class I SAM-dependent methyltransferase [Polyangiaceae bacterium]
MTAHSLGKKPKVAAADLAVIKKLREVRRHRQPYAKLGRRLLAEVLSRFVPDDPAPIVEIGAGDGQFRDWLPERVLPRITHTEPLAIAAREARKRHPQARVVRASAEHLPFGDGEVAAVIGSCVLDVVSDGDATAREIARVLKPGGVFLHWLDMSTRLNDAFEILGKAELVPLPNVFSDPSIARWPEDMFLTARTDLTLVLEILERHRHPFAKPLRQYLAVFSHVPHTLRPALAEYVQLSESAPLRSALQGMFRSAAELAEPRLRERLANFQGRPVASSRFFESRLQSFFTQASGFAPVFSDIVADAELAPAIAEASTRYVSSCVGEHRQLPEVPEPRLLPEGPTPGPDQMLRELGVFVFVASRN